MWAPPAAVHGYAFTNSSTAPATAAAAAAASNTTAAKAAVTGDDHYSTTADAAASSAERLKDDVTDDVIDDDDGESLPDEVRAQDLCLLSKEPYIRVKLSAYFSVSTHWLLLWRMQRFAS
jgi:hypothetical protein